VIVGLANRALDLTTDMVKSRLRSGTIPDGIEIVQQKVAESAAEISTANTIRETHLRRCVETLESGAAGEATALMQNRLMASHMNQLAKRAIERLCSLSGSRWIFDDHPMQLILRDALAGATHRAYNWEATANDYSQSIGIKSGTLPIGP
jgi:alkylation response protein AidB-like acyl-CoA dehydrogenase